MIDKYCTEMRECKVDEKTIEKLKEIQNTVLLINVDKGDALDKKSKKQALKLLEELIQQINIASNLT